MPKGKRNIICGFIKKIAIITHNLVDMDMGFYIDKLKLLPKF